MENIVVAKMVWGQDEYKFMYNDLSLDKVCPICHSWLGFGKLIQILNFPRKNLVYVLHMIALCLYQRIFEDSVWKMNILI